MRPRTTPYGIKRARNGTVYLRVRPPGEPEITIALPCGEESAPAIFSAWLCDWKRSHPGTPVPSLWQGESGTTAVTGRGREYGVSPERHAMRRAGPAPPAPVQISCHSAPDAILSDVAEEYLVAVAGGWHRNGLKRIGPEGLRSARTGLRAALRRTEWVVAAHMSTETLHAWIGREERLGELEHSTLYTYVGQLRGLIRWGESVARWSGIVVPSLAHVYRRRETSWTAGDTARVALACPRWSKVYQGRRWPFRAQAMILRDTAWRLKTISRLRVSDFEGLDTEEPTVQAAPWQNKQARGAVKPLALDTARELLAIMAEMRPTPAPGSMLFGSWSPDGTVTAHPHRRAWNRVARKLGLQPDRKGWMGVHGHRKAVLTGVADKIRSTDPTARDMGFGALLKFSEHCTLQTISTYMMPPAMCQQRRLLNSARPVGDAVASLSVVFGSAGDADVRVTLRSGTVHSARASIGTPLLERILQDADDAVLQAGAEAPGPVAQSARQLARSHDRSAVKRVTPTRKAAREVTRGIPRKKKL